MTVNELRKARADHWESMKNFLNTHEQKDGTLTVDDTATYEKMEAKLEEYNASVERAEKAQEIENKMNTPANKRILESVGEKKTVTENRSTEAYNKAFNTYLRTRKVSNTLEEGTASEGGYLVPTEFERTLFVERDKVDPIFDMTGVLLLGSMTKEVPYVDEEGEADWISEGASYPESDDSFGQVILRANKVGKITKVTEELLKDSAIDVSAFIAGSLGRAIGKAEARAYWTGNGTGKPLGVMNCAGDGVTTAGNKPTADELIDLFYALAEQYRGVGYWAMNGDTVKEIRKLKTGDGQYLWAPGLNNAPDTILGRPLRTSDYIDTIAAGKSVIAFGDFLGCYKRVDRQGIELMALYEKYADKGEVGFRGSARTDGKGIHASVGIKLLKIKA